MGRAEKPIRFDALLESRWVLAIEGTDDEVGRVVRKLGSIGVFASGKITLIVMEPERQVDASIAALRILYEPEPPTSLAGLGLADVYRLKALTPPDEVARRAMLRARNEAFCAAADVVVVCGTAPDAAMDPGHYTLRMALARVKPVIWLEQRGDWAWRLSAVQLADASTTTSPADYDALVEQLLHLRDTDSMDRWKSELGRLFSNHAQSIDPVTSLAVIQAWWRLRVEPVILKEAALDLPRRQAESKGRSHKHHHHQDSEAVTPSIALERLGDLAVTASGIRRWWFRVAGSWHLLLSTIVVELMVPSIRGLRRFWRKAGSRWLSACFRRGSLNRPNHNYRYDADKDRLHLHNSDKIGSAFDIADELALADSGRYRSAIWLGYLLSTCAVLAASIGAMNPLPVHADETQLRLGAAWGVALFALTYLAINWPKLVNRFGSTSSARSMAVSRRPALVLGLCSFILAMTLVGAVGFTIWHALPLTVIVEISALVMVLVLVSVSWTLKTHERWLSTRAFAEAIRFNQMLMPGLALNRTSRQAAFRIATNGLVLVDGLAWWLARARAWQPLPRATSGRTQDITLGDRDYLLGYAFYLHRLVAEQAAYHAARAAREATIHHRLHNATVVLFSMAVLSALAHLLHFGLGTVWASVFTFLTIALPVSAAGLHAINGQLESSRHAGASRAMLTLLEQSLRNLDKLKIALEEAPHDSAVAWDQVARLRREAVIIADAMMADVTDWFRLVAAQPLVVPA